MEVVYQAKQNNTHADALSRQPLLSPPLEDDSVEEVQVAVITNRGESNNDNTITDVYQDLPSLLVFH